MLPLARAVGLASFLTALSAQDTAPARYRFATFNVALNRPHAGALVAELRGGKSAQAHAVAEIVQRVRPDVLLINEIDHDPAREALALFCAEYLAKPHGEVGGIEYPHSFSAPVNTGVPSGLDLDRDGKPDGPGDALGYGAFPGQYGMALLSRFPIVEKQVRTFRDLRWGDVPGALWPDDPSTEESGDYYAAPARAQLRLSSKSHWDIPIRIGNDIVHVLACHPTPPVFDGAEDRNGRRNHDEIRLWADYVEPERAGWICDDAGRSGGLAAGAHFVILGDLNADPMDGDSHQGAIAQLLEHPRIDARTVPRSPGGHLAARRQGGVNARHRGEPSADTSDFRDDAAGNLRLDYVLPSRTLSAAEAGVFWPVEQDPLFRLVGDGDLVVSSDHRLVWLDVRWPPHDARAAPPGLVGQDFGDLHGLRFLAPFSFADHDLTLVRWWTNTCPMCAASLPALESLRQECGARGLAVVAVYHPKPQREVGDREVRHHAQAAGYRGDLAVDLGWDKLADLQARGAPTEATSISVLVDRTGKIIWVHGGMRLHPDTSGEHPDAAAAFAALEAFLAERLR